MPSLLWDIFLTTALWHRIGLNRFLKDHIGVVSLIIFLSTAVNYALWFLLPSTFFYFPCLISAVADWMYTMLPHMVWP